MSADEDFFDWLMSDAADLPSDRLAMIEEEESERRADALEERLNRVRKPYTIRRFKRA